MISDFTGQNIIIFGGTNGVGLELAKRTSDESGDYVVKPFPVKVVDDAANSNFDQVVVGAGKGYVSGFRIETLNNSFIPIQKGINTANIDSAVISQDFGNYVEVDELVGTFEFNTGVEVFLMDAPGNRISDWFVLIKPIDILFVDSLWSIIICKSSFKECCSGSNQPLASMILSLSFCNSISSENTSVTKKEEPAKSTTAIKNLNIFSSF